MTTTDQDVAQATKLLAHVFAMTNGDFRRATMLLHTAESACALWTVMELPPADAPAALEQLMRDCIAFRDEVVDRIAGTSTIPTPVNPTRPF